MSIVFKKIPGLKIAGLHSTHITEKFTPSAGDLVDIARGLVDEKKIPHFFRELLQEVADTTDEMRDHEFGIDIDTDILKKVWQTGMHFGRCSISPLTNPGDCTHEVLITMVVSGKSEVLLLNV